MTTSAEPAAYTDMSALLPLPCGDMTLSGRSRWMDNERIKLFRLGSPFSTILDACVSYEHMTYPFCFFKAEED